MKLPVTVGPALPVVPQRDWVELDRRKLRKTYEFDSRDARLAFVVQLLSTNDQSGEQYKLLVDGTDVIVGIEALDGSFIDERDRKSARYADTIYRDVVRYRSDA